MARMRTVKPGLRTSQVVASWKREVRYFWVLLWGYLDDEGRGLDIPKTIAGDCFPLDDDITAKTIDRWLSLMAATKISPDRVPPICRYEVAGRRYIHALNFGEHQRPNRPQKSTLPPCPNQHGDGDAFTESFTADSGEPDTADAVNDSVPVVRGFEGLRGRGVRRAPISEPPDPSSQDPPTPEDPPTAEPPRTCRDHRDDPDPPNCRNCGDARRAHEAWAAEEPLRQLRAEQARRHREAQERAEVARLAIARCRDCDQGGYLPTGAVCPHDPNAVDRARRGAAAARATLTTEERP